MRIAANADLRSTTDSSSPSTRKDTQKLTSVHAVLECLAAIDKHHRHLVIVLLPQLGVAVDVHLAPLEVGLALKLRKRLLDDVAKMTSIARINHHVVHVAIVKGRFETNKKALSVTSASYWKRQSSNQPRAPPCS